MTFHVYNKSLSILSKHMIVERSPVTEMLTTADRELISIVQTVNIEVSLDFMQRLLALLSHIQSKLVWLEAGHYCTISIYLLAFVTIAICCKLSLIATLRCFHVCLTSVEKGKDYVVLTLKIFKKRWKRLLIVISGNHVF